MAKMKMYSDEYVAKVLYEKVRNYTKRKLDEKTFLPYVKAYRLNKERQPMTEDEFRKLIDSLNIAGEEFKKRLEKRYYTDEEMADKIFLSHYVPEEFLNEGDKNPSYEECLDFVKEHRTDKMKKEMTEREFEKVLQEELGMIY